MESLFLHVSELTRNRRGWAHKKCERCHLVPSTHIVRLWGDEDVGTAGATLCSCAACLTDLERRSAMVRSIERIAAADVKPATPKPPRAGGARIRILSRNS